MLYNAYGNYVVQRAIGNANQEDQIKLLYLIAPLMEELKKYNLKTLLLNWSRVLL